MGECCWGENFGFFVRGFLLPDECGFSPRQTKDLSPKKPTGNSMNCNCDEGEMSRTSWKINGEIAKLPLSLGSWRFGVYWGNGVCLGKNGGM